MKKIRPHPLYEGSPGQVWMMGTRYGCWAIVLCVGERRAKEGNFPCVMLGCSELGWANASERPGTVVNLALGSARAWRRFL